MKKLVVRGDATFPDLFTRVPGDGCKEPEK